MSKSEDDIFAAKIKDRLAECQQTKANLEKRDEELKERKKQITERLDKIEEVRAEMSYVTDERERARAVEFSKNLDALEKTLKEEAKLRDEELRLNKNWASAETALENTLKNTNIPIQRRIEAIESTRKNKISPIRNSIIATLDKTILNSRTYDQYGGSRRIYEVRTPCPKAASAGIYPPRNKTVENVGKAIIATLDAEKAVAPGSGGRSIGIAELEDGSIVITMSGAKDDVKDSMNIIQQNLHKHIQLDRKILFVSEEVPNLKLAPPLKEGATPPSKKCAMPKIYYTAEKEKTKVVSPTEIWWSGGKKPPAKNPCPDKDDPEFMYPCEFCAWNAKSVQNGTAWK